MLSQALNLEMLLLVIGLDLQTQFRMINLEEEVEDALNVARKVICLENVEIKKLNNENEDVSNVEEKDTELKTALEKYRNKLLKKNSLDEEVEDVLNVEEKDIEQKIALVRLLKIRMSNLDEDLIENLKTQT